MKKRIMILGMSPRVGGVETYIMNCLRHINRSKYEFYFPYRTEIAYREELLQLGANLLKIEVSRHQPIHYFRYINQLFKQIRFDAVYYNTCDIMSMDMIMFGKKNGVSRRIIHSHSSSNIVEPNFFHRLTEKWCRKHLDDFATDLIACSEVAGKWMFDGRPFEIIKNGIDVKKYTYSQQIRTYKREELGLKDQFVLGFVGSLWDCKNPLFLIDLIYEISKKKSNTILLVVGDGVLRDQMKSKATELGVLDKVMFLGVRSDVAQLMCAMDHFVLPSKFEGLPFVLVEAQCSGLPCTTSSNVSKEANITGEVNYLNLDESFDKWVDCITSKKCRYPRAEYPSILKSAGYDIVLTVERIESYLE